MSDQLEKLVQRYEQTSNDIFGDSIQNRVAVQSAQRRALKSDTNLPENEDDFLLLNPNASMQDVAQFRGLKEQQAQKELADAAITRDYLDTLVTRDAGSNTQDAANAVAKGTIGLGQIAYGAADLISRYNPTSQGMNAFYEKAGIDVPNSLDEAVAKVRERFGGKAEGLAQNFQRARNITDEILGSDISNYERQNIQQEQQAYAKEVDAETLKQGSGWVQEAKGLGKKALKTVELYLDSPAQIIEQTVEELPQLLLGGGAGSLAAKSVVSGLGKEEAKRYLASEAGQKALNKYTTVAGVGTAAISEAMSNAVDTRAQIEQMSEKALTEQSPLYIKYREQGLNHIDAQRKVADRAFDITTALTLPTAALASKLTGAGKLEGSLFTPGSALGKSVLKPLKSTVSEGVEETIQSGAGQAIQNLAVQQTANENQNLTDNVGEAIGQGAVVGAGSGLTLTALSSSPELVSETVKASADKADKVLRKGAKVLEKATDAPEYREAVASGNLDAVTDENNNKYSPDVAIKTMLNEKFIPIRDEANENPEQYTQRLNEYKSQLSKHIGNKRNELIARKEAGEKVTQEVVELNDVTEKYFGVTEALEQNNVEEAINVLNDVEAAPEEVEQAKQSVLQSMDLGFDSVDIESAENLLKSDKLDDTEKARVTSYIQTAKSMEQVSRDVLKGSEGFLGLGDYQTGLSTAIKNSDEAKATQYVQGIKDFSESHTNKAEKFQAAFQLAKDTNENQKVNHNGKNYSIHKGSNQNGFIDKIVGEKDAIAQVYQALVNQFNQAYPNNAQSIERDTSSANLPTNTTESATTEANINTNTDSVQAEQLSGNANNDGGRQGNNVSGNGRSTVNGQNQSGKAQSTRNDNVSANRTTRSDGESVPVSNRDGSRRDAALSLEEANTVINEAQRLGNATFDTKAGEVTVNGKTYTDLQKAAKVIQDNNLTENTLVNDVLSELNQKEFTSERLTSGKINNNQIGDYLLPSKKDTLLNTVNDLANNLDNPEYSLKNTEGLKAYISAFKKAINNSIELGTNPNFLKNNLVQLMINDADYKGADTNLGDALDDNVVTAMALSSLKWLGTRGEDTLQLTDKEIKRSLGLADNDYVPNDLFSAINNAGTATFLITQDLGKDVVSSVGFRINKETAPVNTREMLAESFGSIMLGALHDLGLVQETRIPKKDIDALLDEDSVAKSPNQFSEYIFTKVIDNKTFNKAKDIYKLNDDAFESLFGMPNVYRKPSFTQDVSVAKTVDGKDQKLSAKQRASIKRQQDTPVKLNGAILDLFDKLGDEFILKMEGFVADPRKEHARNQESVKGKNEALKRSLKNLQEFTQDVYEQSEGIDTPFYFKFKAVSNNRVMIDSNTVNYQGDKLHRHAMVMDGWNSTIDTAAKRDLYKVALGQALGVDIDKQTIKTTVSDVDALLKNSTITAAVDALRRIQQEEEPTSDDYEAIEKALNLGGEKSHTFAGLVSLLNYSDTEPFNTNLFLEVDGITNGTAIALTQMVPEGIDATLDKLRKVGIYSGKEKSFGQFKENGGLDNYESLAATLQRTISGFAQSNPEFYKVAAALGNILGRSTLIDKFGETVEQNDPTFGLIRSIAKNPVMIGNYGAGDTKIVSEFVEEVNDKFYSKLTAYANEGNQGALTLLQRNLEQAIGYKVPEITVNNALKWEMSPEVSANFKSATRDTLGDVMSNALKDEFGGVIQQRQHLNKLMAVANEVFTLVYKAKAEEIINKNGFITVKQNEDLLNELEPLMPKFAHAKSEKSRNTFINLTATEKKVDKKDRSTLIETKFKGKLKNGNTKSRKIFTPKDSFVGVGARPVVLGIQANDSANMVDAFNNTDTEFMNIFDAVITGIDGIAGVSQKINQAMVDNNKDYSLYESFAKSLKDVYNATPKEYKARVDKLIVNSKVGESIQALSGLPKARKELFNKIDYTVQYNLEGAGYSTRAKTQKTIKQNVEAFTSNLKEGDNSVLKSDINSPDTGYSNIVSEFDLNTSTVTGLMTKLRNAATVKSTSKHANHLMNLMTNLYGDLINPIKLKVAEDNVENSGFYNINKQEIQVNLNKNTQLSSIEMGADEVLAHELVHSITQLALEKNNPVSRQVAKLFRDARKVIKPEDLMGKNGNLADAQKRWDYIFNNPNKTKGTNYSVGIHEFVAMGVTNEQFMLALKDKVNTLKYIEGNTLLEKVFNVYAKAVNVIKGLFDNTAGLSTDKKLQVLVRDLATYEAKAKQKSYVHDFTNKIDNTASQVLKDFILEPFAEFLDRPAFSQNKFGVVRGLATAGNLAARGKFNEWRKAINKVLYRLGATENNLMVAILNEVAGRVDENNWAFELARESNKLIDQTRAEIASNIQQHVLKQFGRELTTEEEIAITKVLLKTDMAALTSGYTAEQLHSLITKPRFLNKEIAKAENELKAFKGNRIYYIRMAKSLGHFMVTGRFTESVGLMNAHAISQLVMTGRKVPSDAAQAEPIIDRLASLHALLVSSQTHKDAFKKVSDLFVEEFNNDPEDNGITFTLLNQVEYKKRALDKLFSGNKMLTVKGYTKEIFNPNKSFIIAPESDSELLEKDGFIKVDPREGRGEVPKDRHDVNKGKVYMYISDNAGLSTWMAGGVTTSNMNAKGTTYYDTLVQAGYDDPYQVVANDTALLLSKKQQAAKDIYNGYGNPREQQTLVPTLDDKGNVANFRYLMADSVKDDILERDERFSHVLGATEGNFISKVNGQEINSRYVDALHQDYLSDYNKDQGAYSFIGETSNNVEHAELWRLLPNEMKQEVRSKFNKDGLYVKTDLIKVVFGQRKFSLNVWAKDRLKLQEMQGTTALTFLNPVLKALGSNKAGSIEQGWKEIVTMVKDTIVIKSVEVLFGNIFSNNILLWTLGVPLNEIASRQAEAVLYAESYQGDRERVLELEREIKVLEGKAKSAKNIAAMRSLQADKVTLEDSIERNPVKDLIEAGIYQSIIEDVEVVNDQYSYKTKIENWVSPVTDRVPNSVKTIASYAAMTQDTKVYKLLRRSTQLSDFAARYALHQTNLENGMTREASLNRIEDIFVNYDLPTHKSIQYLNDIGGLFFTKFFMRIQKIIYHTMVKNPARVLGLTWIQDIFGNFSDIADSSVIFRDIFSMFNFNPLEVLDGVVDTHPMINIIN